MRHYRILLLTVLIASGCAALTQRQPAGSHAVATSSGVAQGGEQVPGVLLWQDIPYARPPVGDLRWRAPRPLALTTAAIPVADGSRACMQQASITGGVDGEGIAGSEDCLYLDVRAPASASTTPRPVMVWIHGGGNTTGYKGYYDFSALVARQDVVVVTLNYRLGPLGWFTHPAIQQGQSGLDRASNFGTLDIIQALHWVAGNISAFGGDPGNITVFGESAGGHNVYALLASPLTGGLFHKAIVQSGYVSSASVAAAYNAGGRDPHIARGGWQLANALLQPPAEDRPGGEPPPALTAQQLREVSGAALLQAYYALDASGYVPLTTSDDVVIPQGGMLAALANPEYAKRVPVIAGANRDEVSLWLGVHRYFVDASYPLTRWLPPRLRLKDPGLYGYWVGVRSHAWKLRGVDQPLAALETAGYRALFAYRFDWDDQAASFFADFPALIGAAHGTDISFITGDYRYGPITRYVYPESAQRDQMEQTMMTAWGDFARHGNPGTISGVAWTPYALPEQTFLHLDSDENLRLARESQTLDGLLDGVAQTDALDELQQCLLVWETLTRVGEPDYAAYTRWNSGQCAAVDAGREQARINAQLRERHGSETVL